MPYIVNAEYVRSRILPSLIGASGRYAGRMNPELIQDFVNDAKCEIEQRLSTRFTVTRMVGWLGPHARPANVAAVPAVGDIPAVEAIEYEEPYAWPSMMPSDGFLNWRLRIRPLIEIIDGDFVIPGTVTPGVNIKSDWMRVSSFNSDVALMPQYGVAALVLPNLPFGLFNWMQQRINQAMIWRYRAGMDESVWQRFPQINYLVGLRAGIRCLPHLAMHINPSGITSQSADGLSISRQSGYVFKDIEERLKNEADAIQSQILDAWDGTTSLMVL